ncbi:MAG: hypothetical protein ACKO4Z_08440 [Planctomycetota bacterium]
MNYVLLGLVAVSLLAGLIAIGAGNRGWSWGTVAAAILTLLMAAGYLVVASRMAAYEWAWTKFVRGKQAELADVRDGLVPEQPGGRLVPAPGKKSLDALASERDRWQRAFERIDSWRSRHWDRCEFTPPDLDDKDATGTVVINLTPRAPAAPDGESAAGEDPAVAAEAAPDAAPPAEAGKPGGTKDEGGLPPFDPGAIIYLFEMQPAQDGGRYLGALRIVKVGEVTAEKTCSLTVMPAESADRYDREVWSKTYDEVAVYDELPADRWLAFSTTPQDDDGSGMMPMPAPRSLEEIEELIGAANAQRSLAAEVGRHETETIDDRDEWPRIRGQLDSGELLPGQYWATFTIEKDITDLGEKLADEDAKRELLAGTEAEFDLQTAYKLQEDGYGTIQAVRFRRPLRDAGTQLYGGLVGSVAEQVDARGIPADGIAGLVAATKREIERLTISVAELEAAQKSVGEEAAATAKRKDSSLADLRNWSRDSAAAERLAAGFAAELEQSKARLRTVTSDVVERGRELRTAIRALSARIDAAAPPPARATAVP